MLFKSYYSNILKFDFLTRYNYFESSSVVSLDSLNVSLIPLKSISLKEHSMQLFQYFFMVQWLLSLRPFVKNFSFDHSDIKFIFNIKLQNSFFFSFLDYYFFFLINYIYIDIHKLDYNNSSNVFSVHTNSLNKLPNLPQRFFHLKYDLFFNFCLKNETINSEKLVFFFSFL